MTRRNVLILGGHGSFGRFISEALAKHPNANVLVGGRNAETGQRFAKGLGVDFCRCDATKSESLHNAMQSAWLVINASGPFSAQDYSIPQACITAGSHYIDIADGREYVTGISRLDEAAGLHEQTL